jgi:hypothetical protein
MSDERGSATEGRIRSAPTARWVRYVAPVVAMVNAAVGQRAGALRILATAPANCMAALPQTASCTPRSWRQRHKQSA